MHTHTWTHLPSSAALAGLLVSGAWARYWTPPASWRAMQQPTCAALAFKSLRLGAQANRRNEHLLCFSSLSLSPSQQRQEAKTIVSLGGAAPPPPPPPPATTMDRFPDGTHVWLRSLVRERDAYLFADDDGSGVSLSASRAMLNAAWRVQIVLHDGTPCLRLQSAAYGHYLALSPYLPPHGHRGRLAILRDFHEPRQRNIRWRAIAAGDGSDDVLLCTLEDPERYLRAHGGLWKTCSCITIERRRSTMAHWTVLQIPPRPAPPALPTPSTALGGRTDWRRKIRCKRANDQGNLLGTATFEFKFFGRSVFNLRSEVATKVDEDMSTITLCVRAGFYGRLTPLVIDLPRSEDPLDIVILPSSSPAAKSLVHPDIGPPPPPTSGIKLLTDGAFVRLKCRVRGQDCYLHAQEDGLHVNLSPEATCLQDVWAIHLLEIDGDDFLLFRGAAYGRYFALMPEGKTGRSRFAQVNYDEPEQSNLLWVATSLKGSSQVTLSSGNGDTGLGVCWTVEVVAMSPTLPLHPAPAAEKEPRKNTGTKPSKRMIWFRQGDDMKATNPWTSVVFKGKSLSALRSQLSNDCSLTLCIRAGRYGQLTPLVTDLPNNEETMEIIILTPGSPVAQELRYPVVNPRVV